jgi:ATP-binding cassette subfamily C (CFTR/MRP) protein 1
MLQIQRGYIAARRIHDRCFESLIRAPSSFFDTTPIGRVLNRFSRDQDIIDNNLSESLRMLSFLSASIIGILIMMCFVQPFFILALGPILYMYWYFQHVYRRVNREIKRMDSTSRSPLFAHFSETLTGLPTIRAYGQQLPFIATNAARMDENNRFYFLIAASQRWLGTRLETLGGLIIFCTAIIAASNSSSIGAGLAGLSLSYSMQVTNMLSFFLRQSVESENYMNSVERSKFYTEQIAREAPPILPIDSKPELAHDVWPSKGHIRFENVSLRYREGLKLVLQDVNIDIRGGQRIGIVGRTGAGELRRMTRTAHRRCNSMHMPMGV